MKEVALRRPPLGRTKRRYWWRSKNDYTQYRFLRSANLKNTFLAHFEAFLNGFLDIFALELAPFSLEMPSKGVKTRSEFWTFRFFYITFLASDGREKAFRH